MYACGSDHTCGQDVHGFSVVSVFNDFGGTWPKEQAREVNCLLVEWGLLYEKMSKRGVKGGKWMGTCMPKSTMMMSLSGSLEW